MASKDIPKRVRAVFISDLHLGCRLSQAAEIRPWLEQIETQSLYLVGDVVDVARLVRHWWWPTAHQEIIDRIVQMSDEGTLVRIAAGNHDECFRVADFFGRSSYGGNPRIESICRPLMQMRPAESFDHETATGERLWVVHGDVFDRVGEKFETVTRTGSRIFDRYNRWLPDRLNHGIRSFFKWLLTRPDKIEAAVMAETRQRGYDGVVFGHLHRPRLERVEDGLVVANTGDWVENRSFLVETVAGQLSLVNGGRIVQQLDP